MAPSPSIRKPSVYSLRIPSKHAPSFLTVNRNILRILRALTVLLVFYAEYLSFYFPTRACSFPGAPSPAYPGAPVEKIEGSGYRVLVTADPQLLDMHSYPERLWIARKLGVWFTDNYLRKAWRFVIKSKGAGGGVDAVIWLGDLLDSGVESVDRKEHSHYVHRFNMLFPLPRAPSSSPSSLTPPIPSIQIPGNHDLGLHLSSASLATYHRERFQANFGELNGERIFGGWSIVWVDSMGLLEDEEGVDSRKFVEDLRERDEKDAEDGKDTGKGWRRKPRVLLTHIPLWREEGTECGIEREHSRPIYQGEGKNYQNELDKATSEWLLRSLGPNVVFSGDDHDHCQVTHIAPPHSPPSSPSMVPELTVKSLSMAMGVDRPGYTLLTLFPPLSSSVNPGSYATQSCLLPSQVDLWLSLYTPAFIFVVIFASLPKLFGGGKRGGKKGLPTYSHNHSRSLSRKVLEGPDLGSGGGEGVGDGDEEEDPFVFPTFPFQNSATGGYLSSLLSATGGEGDDGYLPMSGSQGTVDGRVRRVSRVWSWDPLANPRGGNAGNGGSGRVLGRKRGVWWKVGLWKLASIPAVLLRVATGNQVAMETLKEVGLIAGPAVGFWLALWIWFAL